MTYGVGEGGFAAFERLITQLAVAHGGDAAGTRRFVNDLAARCAGIHLDQMHRPVRFLLDMQGNPPQAFGVEGFDADVVDDLNPARHYVAFVFVGFWLPKLLAVLVLYGWEVASFFRYRGHWSPKDIESGFIGIEHGRAVVRHGAGVLATLARRDIGV